MHNNGSRFLTELLLCLLPLVLLGCHPRSYELDPHLYYAPQRAQIECLPQAFPPLTPKELESDWGKELKIAYHFAKQLDLYRAITNYQRAWILMPEGLDYRKAQCEYSIVLCYYLGGKYRDAISYFETCRHLIHMPENFPVIRELLIIIDDCYSQLGEEKKADYAHQLIKNYDPKLSSDLQLGRYVETADFCALEGLEDEDPRVRSLFDCYVPCSKSVKRAQALNALLPGAGYLYVEQKKTALTSLILNSLFIGATYYFCHEGNIPAALITGSLELGWYVGGINGAGLAAKEWNQKRYDTCARAFMIQNKLFPVLQFHTTF